MFDKLKSRKLWAAVASAVIVAFGDQLGVPSGHTLYLAGIVVAYILGQSVVDAAEKKAVGP
jgi:hypothetical protein